MTGQKCLFGFCNEMRVVTGMEEECGTLIIARF